MERNFDDLDGSEGFQDGGSIGGHYNYNYEAEAGLYEVESSDPDEEVVEIDIEKNLGPDFKYAGQFGYSWYASLRGDTPGRHLKRDIFNFAIVQLVCGIVFIVTLQDSVNNLAVSEYLHHSNNCEYFRGLTWFIGIANMFTVFVAIILVYFWSTLVTNRQLMVQCLRFYCSWFVFVFAFAVWDIVSCFLCFRTHQFSQTDDSGNTYHTYIACGVCLFIFDVAIIAAVFDIWAYTEDVVRGGTIAEINGKPPIADLSAVEAVDVCLLCVAIPLGCCLQLADMGGAILRYFLRCVGAGSVRRTFVVRKTNSAGEIETTTISRKQGSGFCARCCKTFVRILSCQRRQRHEVVPADGDTQDAARNRLTQRLAELRQKRFKAEESDLQQQQEQQADLEAGSVPGINPVADETDVVGEMLTSRKELERKLASVSAKEKENDDATSQVAVPQTLTVTQYKALWSTLESNGSFQCKLREDANMHKLVEHLRKQGFHIVFASQGTHNSSSSNELQQQQQQPTVDIEIGICNILTPTTANPAAPDTGEESKSQQPAVTSWFLARFIISNRVFSAAMKSQDPELVRVYVKKFSLAKTLKIDTSANAAV